MPLYGTRPSDAAYGVRVVGSADTVGGSLPHVSEGSWRGKVGRMSDEERDAFLALGKPMRLSCLKPDGSPYITVCWHDWHEGWFWLVPRQRSRWAKYLEQDGRLAFVVDDDQTLEKVIGEGVAELVERPNVGGSGSYGFDLTDAYDCHIYLVDGGSELALVDVGAGMGAAEVIANVRRAGFDPAAIRHVLCTHAHGDHAGGAARMRALLPNASFSASPYAAELVRTGDEGGTSIGMAKAAGIYPPDYSL